MQPAVCPPRAVPPASDTLHVCLALWLLLPLLVAVPAIPARSRRTVTTTAATAAAVFAVALLAAVAPSAAAAAALAALHAMRFPRVALRTLPAAAATSSAAAAIGLAQGALGAHALAALAVVQCATAVACVGASVASWRLGYSDGGEGSCATAQGLGGVEPQSVPPTLRDCSALSLMYTTWLTPLLRVSRARLLTLQDFSPLTEGLRCAVVSPKLRSRWDEELRRGAAAASLARAFGKTFGSQLALCFLLMIGSNIFLFLGPMALQRVIFHLQEISKVPEKSGDAERGMHLVVTMLGIKVAQSFFDNNYGRLMHMVYVQANSALVGLIFEKTCRISSSSIASISNGYIHNCMAVDAQLVSGSFGNLFKIMSGVPRILVAIYFLQNLFGTGPMAAGVCVVVLICPIQILLVRKTKEEAVSASARTDERVGLVEEALSGISVIKYMAWERSYLRRVLDARRAELSHLRRIRLFGAINLGISISSPVMLSLVSFSTFAWFGGKMDASIIFPAFTFFSILKTQFKALPGACVSLVRSGSSLERCRQFLLADNLPRPHVDSKEFDVDGCDVVATDARISWGKEVVLSSVNLRLPAGTLTCVVGKVASGKSSLLAGILGEAQAISGKIGMRQGRSVGYMPQQSFIRNATLRENVLFGLEMNEGRYRDTLRVSGLLPDLSALPNGDLTMIGGRGVNLSGGQRARCSLARVVYSNADIVLLDNPLAAVDTHVARCIWEDCITGTLRNRTRVVTTNNLELAASSSVDFVVVIEGGVVAEVGRRENLLKNQSSRFSLALEKQTTRATNGEQKMRKAKARAEVPSNCHGKQSGLQPQQPTIFASAESPRIHNHRGTCDFPRYHSEDYMIYLGAVGGGLALIVAVSVLVLEKMTSFQSNLLLSSWSEEVSHEDCRSSSCMKGNLAQFAFVTILATLFPIISNLVTAVMSLRASVVLQEKLCLRVFASPSWWFDCTSMGKVLHCFQSCIDKIDSQLALILQSCIRLSLRALAEFCLLMYADATLFVPVVLTGLLYAYIEKHFRAGALNLHRLKLAANASIQSHFGEVLDGVETIRAFSAVPRFRDESALLVDLYTTSACLHSSSTRWLADRLEVLGHVLVSFTAAMSILAVSSGRLSPELCSMTLTYASRLVSHIYCTVRRVSEARSHISAVAQLSECSEVPPHPQEQDLFERANSLTTRNSSLAANWAVVRDLVTPGFSRFVSESETRLIATKASSWPSRGEIEFRNVCMRYRPDSDLALRRVSFKLKGGTTLGICGRTGAGKTSLVSALFRMQELEAGQILIDGTDIAKVPIEALRSSLGAIAQSPTLYSGTIRENLDMPMTRSKASVSRALHLCGLDATTESGRAELNLDTAVGDGGTSLSAGQKQLICLGRVLLRGPQVCVLDEATSSVDGETDARMAAAIASELAGRTLLIVAHRLHSIMHCNQVLVMDNGAVAEFGTPSQLLDDPSSALSQLVDESGPVPARRLRQIARAVASGTSMPC